MRILIITIFLTKMLAVKSWKHFKNTLIVASKTDPASVNIFSCLVSQYRGLWSEECEGLYRKENVFLWLQDKELLKLNHVDKLFKEINSFEEEFDDVIFLSRHSASSGTASLTVHPIGIPWQTSAESSGGIPGKCSPPNMRMATIYRSLLYETKRMGIADTFSVTLEATHHGPFCEKPACFVEIGSTENGWGNVEAGNLWADVLMKHLGFVQSLEESNDEVLSSERTSTPPADLMTPTVVMTIGGGHYCPKTNDVARFGEGLFLGHCLATYTLKGYFDGSVENPVPGGWQAIIQESLDSTRIGMPCADLIVLIDKKAFKSDNNKAITTFLEELGVAWTFTTNDVKSRWKKNLGTPASPPLIPSSSSSSPSSTTGDEEQVEVSSSSSSLSSVASSSSSSAAAPPTKVLVSP